MELLPSQRVEIFNVLKGTGVDPAQVTLTEARGFASADPAPIIRVPNTKYFFAFDINASMRRRVKYSPAEDKVMTVHDADSWLQQLIYLERWCHYLQRELSAGDPWAELQRQSVSINLDLNDPLASQPFSVGEFEKVEKTISVLQALLLTYAKDNEHAQTEIKNTLGKLLDSAKSQDRKTWFFTVAGFIASTAVSLALAPEQTRALYQVLKDGLVGAIALMH